MMMRINFSSDFCTLTALVRLFSPLQHLIDCICTLLMSRVHTLLQSAMRHGDDGVSSSTEKRAYVSMIFDVILYDTICHAYQHVCVCY